MSTDRMTRDEIRDEFRRLHEEIGALREQIANMGDALMSAAADAGAGRPRTPTGTEEIITIDEIVMTIGDDGEPAYKGRGGLYRKFGIRIWPEVLPALEIDPAALRPGPNHVKQQRVRVLLTESGQPRKIVGPA